MEGRKTSFVLSAEVANSAGNAVGRRREIPSPDLALTCERLVPTVNLLALKLPAVHVAAGA